MTPHTVVLPDGCGTVLMDAAEYRKYMASELRDRMDLVRRHPDLLPRFREFAPCYHSTGTWGRFWQRALPPEGVAR